MPSVSLIQLRQCINFEDSGCVPQNFQMLCNWRSQVPEPESSLNIMLQQCFSNPLLPCQLSRMRKMVKLRAMHYPVQYLCRSWPFRELDLKLHPPVLIPRFETEYMVSLIINKIRSKYSQQQIKQLKMVEYGCGSGAIALSICKELGIPCTLLDINPTCINLSKINAGINNLNSSQLTYITGDMENHLDLMENCDIVISNPPYMSQQHYSRYLQKQVKVFEDKNALVAEQNGMKYIRILAKSWASLKKKQGLLGLEYDGRKLDKQDQWLDQYVENDQYERRRFIFM